MNLTASGLAKRIAEIEHARKRGVSKQITITEDRMVIHAQVPLTGMLVVSTRGGSIHVGSTITELVAAS